ncbi:hypothetical protein COP2_009531 [Malus domestica]
MGLNRRSPAANQAPRPRPDSLSFTHPTHHKGPKVFQPNMPAKETRPMPISFSFPPTISGPCKLNLDGLKPQGLPSPAPSASVTLAQAEPITWPMPIDPYAAPPAIP